MIDFVFCCGLFTCGIIAAWVDWNILINNIFHFDNVLKVNRSYAAQKQMRIESNVTNRPEMVYVNNTFDPKIIVFIFALLIVLFFVCIYIPAKILFEHLEGKYHTLKNFYDSFLL